MIIILWASCTMDTSAISFPLLYSGFECTERHSYHIILTSWVCEGNLWNCMLRLLLHWPQFNPFLHSKFSGRSSAWSFPMSTFTSLQMTTYDVLSLLGMCLFFLVGVLQTATPNCLPAVQRSKLAQFRSLAVVLATLQTSMVEANVCLRFMYWIYFSFVIDNSITGC